MYRIIRITYCTIRITYRTILTTMLVSDPSCSIFQMPSTTSSINSGSELHPQLFFIISIILYIYKRIEVSDHKIKINGLRKME